MAFITIVETDEAFAWQPTDEESGKKYDSVFSLRIIPDDVDKDIRKRHTKQVWQKKTRSMVDKLDEPSYIADLIDYAIVGWSGMKAASTGADLPCSTDMKGRIPEKFKAEVLRLCSGKEAGDVVAAAEQEKKALKSS